jgi:hypothetical protein
LTVLKGLQVDIFDVHIFNILGQALADLVVGLKKIVLCKIVPDCAFVLL